VLTKETELRQELLSLQGQMLLLDQRLAEALRRIKHSPCPEAIDQARQDERTLLAQLDCLMTRLRAIKGHLLQIEKSATRH
jgi:hypothetical protein